MARYHFSAVVGHDEDGYWARCPELPGCCVQGDTHEEVLDNLREACALYVEDCLACGHPVPCVDAVSLIDVDVDELAGQAPETGSAG